MRRVSFVLAVAAMLALAPTAGADSTARAWKGTFGTKGSLTVRQWVNGTGLLEIALKGLVPGKKYTITIRTASCSGASAYRTTLAASSTGRVSKKVSLSAAQVTTIAEKPAAGYGSTCKKLSTAAIYYANCTQLHESGSPPLQAGEPGYRSGLDRDNDGTACELEG